MVGFYNFQMANRTALIRMHICTCWSVPLLFACNSFSYKENGVWCWSLCVRGSHDRCVFQYCSYNTLIYMFSTDFDSNRRRSTLSNLVLASRGNSFLNTYWHLSSQNSCQHFIFVSISRQILFNNIEYIFYVIIIVLYFKFHFIIDLNKTC